MHVSIVICTLNRATSLGETLESLRYQNYDEFEVVVVNGPSTDDTEVVLQRWSDLIRIEHCPVPNLSVSRNIGIRAAGGDIVAFIDDDALPEFDWLNQALPAFDDDEVAGVGGIVFDHTGLALQYRYSAANRFAETEWRQSGPFDDQCVPGSFQFPYLQGTNALFRRSRLLSVGGFDETFDYHLDETDLCCRLVDAGYLLRQLADAPVHHKFLPSSVRDHQRVITNWFPIVKNHVYFTYRHAFDTFSESEIQSRSLASMHSRIEDAKRHEDAGRLPPGGAEQAARTCEAAYAAGVILGRERQLLRLGPERWEPGEFKAFPTLAGPNRRKITFVSSGYTPNMTGGIARFISDVAPALARRGHEVRVVTKAVGPPAVDLEQGVWVHRIDTPPAGASGVAPGVLAHVNDFTTAAVEEIERVGGWSFHDVVYGPLWDSEVIGVLRRTGLPVAVQVATPLAVAAEMAGHMAAPDAEADIRRLMALESIVLDEGDLFHANSDAVSTTIADNYGDGDGDGHDLGRWQVVPLGLADHGEDSIASDPHDADGRVPIVLFVGRFEIRKGIDTFLSAVEQVAAKSTDVEFVAVGEDRPLSPGEPLFGQSWMARHTRASWISQVRFEGVVSDSRLHELYAKADVVVLPSRYESFGLVVVEAMMHSRAVISCDTSGIRDVVRHGTDGILVAPGDSEALAKAIDELLANPGRRHELGVAARQRFLEDFHIDRFAERFERFLARVSLVDASSFLSEAGDPIATTRGNTGERVCLLTVGQKVVLPIDSTQSARLCVQASAPATILVGGTTTSVEPGRVSRLPVLSIDGAVTLSVVSGEVTLVGVVSVRPVR